MKHAATFALVTTAALGLGGCRTRTLEITSEPPGALVWLNDEQVGRTPLQTGFVHYGEYDVRVRLEGYSPIVTHRKAGAPLIDQPGIDLVTQTFPGDSLTRWHFTLEPLPESADRPAAEKAVFDRARAFRDHAGRTKPTPPQTAPPTPTPAPTQPKSDAGTPATVAPSGTSPSTTAPAPTTDK